MINLRYHIFSLAAVLLALAGGIALGAGVLKSDDVTTDEAGNERAISPALAGFDAGFAALTAPDLLDNKLEDRTVLVVTLPSAREAEVGGIMENLNLAGAEVVGQVTLTSNFLTTGNRQFVEGVARQSLGDEADAGGAYETISAAFARGYLTTGSADLDETARTIRAAFTEGNLVEVIQDPGSRAELLVIVAGPALTNDAGESSVVSQIVGPLKDKSEGVLVAGPVSSGEDGVIRAVRQGQASSSVTTIDVTDTASGRVAAVLALIREAEGHSGTWGTSRAADGPVPN